ncbi:TIGR01777 family oxidoreductase [Leucobacter komagatae]|uniref:Nucleoside-diphosphate sugar epimerase n=1 Tax=Leucobacter komagatae TaxID=55969 RepID=A0A0D0IWG7_9MICO|nr:TIGR01777 family oxidoreductase [Leucobacter komagatae]KIP53888.1 nucleoside-diphosphate sugar epimerase [Leucobacter komagatae]
MSQGNVVISGSSGLVGSALVRSLRADDVGVTRLVRHEPRAEDEVRWDPEQPLDPAVLAGATAVVNLNGASIGRLPWTSAYRQQLVESRMLSTGTIAAAVSELGRAAPLFVSASAVGFYGDRPGERLTEAATPGTTFLAGLSEDWEAAALSAGQDAKVALLRTAPILHPQGVLKPLVLLTKLGVSGPLGGGRQIWPWISLTDEVRAIRHVIDQGLTGPVNLTGPEPASANDIGRAIASELRRPYLVPAPKWALRLALGRDAADSLLLSDANVAPEALLESGFAFEHPTVAGAVAAALAG